jgi:purine-binding chemotaxis protein CheW
MLGVINLRGKVISVIDLRRKFAMDAIDYTERTCIIVVEATKVGGPANIVGVVVDAVSEVLHIKAENIEEAPGFGTKIDNQAILGMAKEESGVKILLDIDKALSVSNCSTIDKAA